MVHDPFSAHSFDPATLRVLSKAFAASWDSLQPRINDANRERIRNALAEALVDLANAGSRSSRALEAYATDRARIVLGRTSS